MTSSAEKIDRIVLTGFMGAGKSTIGRLLAARLAWRFLDVDAEIESRHGKTIAGLFEEHGEEIFRRFESSAVARALHGTRTIIALGGGALEVLTNRLLLEQTPGTHVVFLDAPFDVLLERCRQQPDAAVRPILADPNTARMRYNRRLPFYRRIASVSIATADQGKEETVGEIVQHLAV